MEWEALEQGNARHMEEISFSGLEPQGDIIRVCICSVLQFSHKNTVFVLYVLGVKYGSRHLKYAQFQPRYSAQLMTCCSLSHSRRKQHCKWQITTNFKQFH